MKKIMVVTQNVGKAFAVGISEALKELGYDVLRSVRSSNKRVNIKIDQNDIAFNKLQQLEKFRAIQVPHPEFTNDPAVALSWVMEDYTVVCRTKTMGYGGDGIVMANSEEELVKAPLYTRYIPKKREFRIHVFGNEIIFYQEKRKRKDVENDKVNYQVRNHENGWVFCHQDVEIPNQEAVFADAVKIVKKLGYRYAAMDVIYNEAKNKHYFLEANSRPGIEGETAKAYAQAFLKELEKPVQPSISADPATMTIKEYIQNLKMQMGVA